jgi:antitoxin StbD
MTIASITELKKSPSGVLSRARGKPVAIVKRNRTTAYLVPVRAYQKMLEAVEDCELGKIVRERQAEKDLAMDVSLDEL